MNIRFSPPLDSIMGSMRHLAVTHPVSVAEALRMLQDQTPALRPYAGFGDGDKQPYGLLVWRGRELLDLKDILTPEDELEMIAMVAGG